MKLNKIITSLAVLAIVMPLSKVEGSTSKNDQIVTEVLSKDNLLVLNEPIDSESAGELITQAKTLDTNLNSLTSRLKGNSKKHIKLFIYSPGGEIESGMELIEVLKGLKHQVDTITLLSASMAFQLVQSLGTREVLQNGTLMSHRASGAFEGSFGGIEPSQLTSRYQLWLDRVTEFDKNTVARTNGKQTLDNYRKQYAEELWLTGTKAVEQGYADKIVRVRCDSSLAGYTTHVTDFMGETVQYDLDNCPLNTAPMHIRLISGGEENNKNGMIIITGASTETKDNIISKFREQFLQKQKQVIPMHW